jgi:hypothetical protein
MKEMVIDCMELEVKEVLDDHGERIIKLEIDSEVSKEKLNNITTQLTRIENNALTSNNALLTSNNAILQTFQQFINNSTQVNSNNAEVIKIKNNNKKEITIRVLYICGIIILGIFAAKGISVTIPKFF